MNKPNSNPSTPPSSTPHPQLLVISPEEQLERVIGSILTTIWLCLTSGERDSKSLETVCSYGHIDYFIRRDGRRILSTCLSAYFGNEKDKQDTLLHRLRNATILLAHADQMLSEPVALALSFAAIEALVCEKEGNVGQQIRQHIPTLLESVPSRRTAKKRDALYDLYAIRSEVLHGSSLSVSAEASSVVRRIAAGAVRAISVWKADREMSGYKPTWKDLITELIIASRNDQPVIPALPGLGELLPNVAPK